MNIDERILGYLLSEKTLTLKVLDKVPAKFLTPEYRELYTIVQRCVKRYNELPTIRMVKADQDWKDQYEDLYNSSRAYKDVEDYDPTDLELDTEQIKDRYNSNELVKFGRDVFRNNYNSSAGEFQDLGEANKKLRKLMAEIDSVRIARTYKEGSLKATVQEAKDKYQVTKDNPESARGIRVGMREFDRITNGLQPAELILIGGESGAGKSALAMNMAINAWRGSNPYPEDREWVEAQDYATDGTNVMYFTIEMPYAPFRRRIDSCLAGIPLYGLRDGNLSEAEEERYQSALRFQELYQKEFYVVDIPRGCTVAQIESKYMELLYEFTPELIVVDYISLMKLDSDDGQDWLNLGRLSEMLHEFCRTYSVPCVTPVQLNRPKPGPNGGMPDQHRVGRSIMLPQNCNIMLNIDSRADETTRPDMSINIAKMRDGEKGAFTLHKRLDMMRIYDEVPGWTTEEYEEVDDGIPGG